MHKKLSTLERIITILRREVTKYPPTLMETIITEYGKNPFLILISCLLSLRAQDKTTIHVCRALFARAQTPKAMLQLADDALEKIIFKSGFYKNKAQVIKHVCRVLTEQWDGCVPCTYDNLIAIKGIGPKTANLVMSMAFDTPAICVDTHVHRISQRLGLVCTKRVDQTEQELKKILPQTYWSEWNRLLVIWGQQVCTPLLPHCSQCAIQKLCQRVGVEKHR